MKEHSEFTLHIETDGAAFDVPGGSDELARILRELADRVTDGAGRWRGSLSDSNGNTVGSWRWGA
jgi:uncharacterized protein YukE